MSTCTSFVPQKLSAEKAKLINYESVSLKFGMSLAHKKTLSEAESVFYWLK